MRGANVDGELIAHLYEAAADPAQWPDLLQQIADQAGAAGGLTMTVGPELTYWTPSPRIADDVEAFFAAGWHITGGRTDSLMAHHPAGFCMETDYLSEDEMKAMPVHREFLSARGLSYAIGTLFQGVRDDAVMLTFEGFASVAAAEAVRARFDALRPHFGRALSLMARLDRARTRSAVDALEIGGVPAAVVDKHRRLRAVNQRFERLFADHLSVSARDGGVHFRDPALHDAVDRVRHRPDASPGRSVALRDAKRDEPAVAHLVPLHGRARDVAGSDGVLIMLASSANRSVPGADLLRLLFDLTPAEARLARAIAEGSELAEAASAAGISVGTARKQLAAVFGKVGVCRQVELVCLLAGLGFPADTGPDSVQVAIRQPER